MQVDKLEIQEVHMNTNTWTCSTGGTIKEDVNEGQMSEGGQRVGNEWGGVNRLEERRHRNHTEMERNKMSEDKKCIIQ